MAVRIRPMTEHDDLDRITDWFESIGHEWLLDYPDVPEKREESRRQLEHWRRGEDGRSRILVAEAGEIPEIVGFAVCLIQADPHSGRDFGTIHGIYVDPPHRCHGTGHKLKEAADDWCREAGAKYMKAFVGVGNEAMLRVCRLLGYEPWMVTWVRKFD